LLERICAAVPQLTRHLKVGGSQWSRWVKVVTVEERIGVTGPAVQQAILLGAETNRLRFAGVPAHSICVIWQRGTTGQRPPTMTLAARGLFGALLRR
jgi:hypothetical protein